MEIYKTLVCDMGLEIPKGHIYKKFSIPEPEEGEEVLKPPVKQMAPAVAGGSEILPEKTSPEDVKALKDEAKLKKRYGQMESPELDDMIQQGIYLSHLVGRSMD